MPDYCIETLSGGLSLFISKRHRFGTDAFLLADFARPRSGEAACDLCAGCGIIPLLLLRSRHAPASVTAVELLDEPVALMHHTAEANALSQRLIPLQADLRAIRQSLAAGTFSLVTCNPPYFLPGSGFVPPDPQRSAARHETGCSLEEVCAAAAWLLKYGGRFCVCHRPERIVDLLCCMRTAGLEPKRLRLVQQRAASAPWLVLAEGRKGGKPSLTVEPPLIVERPDGTFSDQMLAVYGLAAPSEDGNTP